MPKPYAKRALITGITGQDGSYLTELLLRKGYEVHGLIRRSSSFNTDRIDHIYQDPHTPNPKLTLHYGDLTDASCLRDVLTKCKPTEVYNLGAQSHVRVSFDMPVYTVQTDALGTIMMLEAIRDLMEHSGYDVKFYQASSSEMFGKVVESPQKETTPFHPRSPYACAKVYSYWQVVNYRESYNMFACNGILFNHESRLAVVRPSSPSKITQGRHAQDSPGLQAADALASATSTRSATGALPATTSKPCG